MNLQDSVIIKVKQIGLDINSQTLVLLMIACRPAKFKLIIYSRLSPS